MIVAKYSILKWLVSAIFFVGILVFAFGKLHFGPGGAWAMFAAQPFTALGVACAAAIVVVWLIVLPWLSLARERAAIWIDDGTVRVFLSRKRFALKDIVSVTTRTYWGYRPPLSLVIVTTSDGGYYRLDRSYFSDSGAAIAARLLEAAAAARTPGSA